MHRRYPSAALALAILTGMIGQVSAEQVLCRSSDTTSLASETPLADTPADRQAFQHRGMLNTIYAATQGFQQQASSLGGTNSRVTLRSIPSNDGSKTSHTVPDNVVVAALNSHPLKNSVVELLSPPRSPDGGCNTSLVDTYEAIEAIPDAVYGLSPKAHDNQAKKSSERDLAVAKMIGRCYRLLMPEEFSRSESFVGRHHLGSRLGSIQLDDKGICTALLVGDGKHILTARHCFFATTRALPASTLRHLYFTPAVGTKSYQLCAISEPNALTPALVEDVASDQVVVRIAPGLKAPEQPSLPPSDSLHAIEPRAKDAPDITLLVIYSYMPAAKAIFPDSTGFVVGRTDKCAAVRSMSGCFVDFCRAVHGGSGAPVFDVTDPSSPLTLIGTHTGSGAGSKNCVTPQENYNISAYIRPDLKPLILPPRSPSPAEASP